MSPVQPTDESLAHAVGPGDPPVLDMTVGDLLRRAVAMAPERAAIVEGVTGTDRRRWTYRELLRDAEACARALLARYSPGEHVAIWAPNIPEYTVFQCGAALAGMVMVTINPTFRAAELGAGATTPPPPEPPQQNRPRTPRMDRRQASWRDDDCRRPGL
jgi:hypothetical protein